MTALIVNNGLWLVCVAVLAHQAIALHRRVVALQDAREDKYRDHIERLENQIVLLKVDPQQAVVYAAPDVEDVAPLPVDDSPYADAAWAEFQEGSKP